MQVSSAATRLVRSLSNPYENSSPLLFSSLLSSRFRECGLEFTNREALTLHLRLHSGDRTLVTDVALCGLAAAFQQTPGHFLTSNTPGTHQVMPGRARPRKKEEERKMYACETF